jgi:hypothetical protein
MLRLIINKKIMKISIIGIAIILSASKLVWAAEGGSTPLSYADFNFDSEGIVVNIDKNGAELHLHYVGRSRLPAEPVIIKIEDPKIRLRGGRQCKVQVSSDVCKIVLNYKNMNSPSYGYRKITIQKSSGEVIQTYGIWVKPAVTPEYARSQLTSDTLTTDKLAGPVFMMNATYSNREYKITYGGKELPFPSFKLSAKSMCYVDRYFGDVFTSSQTIMYVLPIPNFIRGSGIKDITDPSSPTYNESYATGNNNISTCATEGKNECVSSKGWASWAVGLMNIRGEVIDGTFPPGAMRTQKDRSWNSGDTIYYKKAWNSKRLALLLIEGTADGSRFDPAKLTPPLMAVQTAPPCSYFVASPPNPPVSQTLELEVSGGQGSIVLDTDYSCDTYCRINVDNGALVVATAVPVPGKSSFAGWSVPGCDQNSLTCAVNVTDDLKGITALFNNVMN